MTFQTHAEAEAAINANTSGLADHLADADDAHDATAISYAGSTNLVATTVEEALDELDTEKQSAAALDDSVAALVTTGSTGTALSATFAGLPGQDVAPLTRAELAAQVNTTYPIGSINGLIYGSRTADSKLYTTTDQARTWTLANNNIIGTGSAVGGIWLLSDGEVLVSARSDGLYRSSGWASNSLTATWTRVVQPTSGAWVMPWHVDVSGQYVVCAEYAVSPRDPSDKLWVSTDYGVTFTVRYSLNTTYPSDVAQTHWHAACVDPYTLTSGVPRIWACHGDGPRAIIYSDNAGVSWTTYFSYVGTTFTGEATVATISADGVQPTTLTPLPNGILCGTDRTPDGHQIIDRTTLKMSQVYTLRSTQSSLFGFTNRAIKAAGGEVYTAWTTALLGVDVPITGVTPDGQRGAEVYTVPGVAGYATNIDRICIDSAGWLLADVTVGGVSKVLRAKVNGPGASSYDQMNRGGIFGGRSAAPRDVAVGAGATAAGGGVAVGTGAVGGTDRCVAVGALSSATATRATAVGEEATAGGSFSTALGYAATAGTGASNVLVGRNSIYYVAGAARSIIIGDTAKGNSDCVAIGYQSQAKTASGVAVGGNAIVEVGHASSIALGQGVTTTASAQLAIAARHIEMTELAADAAAGATNAGRLYLKDNGSGKTQLAVRFATGAVQILATEP